MAILTPMTTLSHALSVPRKGFRAKSRTLVISVPTTASLPDNIRISLIDTPFGKARACYTHDALYRLDFEPRGLMPLRLTSGKAQSPFSSDPELSNMVPVSDSSELPEFLHDAFYSNKNLPIHLIGSAKQIEVWKGLAQLSWGETTSYGELARNVFGHKRFARAVGGMVGRNPVAWFIPCHRVLARNGSLNGFGCGLEVKRDMLFAETIAPMATHAVA